MSRRRKSSSKLPLIVFAIIAAAVVAGGILATNLLDPHRIAARLDISGYRESPASFAGNNYVVIGEIAERLAQNPTGAVYALSSDGHLLAFVVPQNARPNFNIEKGQRVLVEIRIAEDGSAVATSLSKE